jgi:hypothetical protein
MKIYYVFIALLFSVAKNNTAQTATSIANGNWTNPLTWNCTCVPMNGYNVTINHNVTLNTSMTFSSGGITVNNGASLIQDASLNRDLWINGGAFENNGTTNFRNLLFSEGSGTNAGNLNLVAFSCLDTFNNSGVINLDSMYVGEFAQFTNEVSGVLIGDSLTVDGTNASSYGTFFNNGRLIVNLVLNNGWMYNARYHESDSITNNRQFDNLDSLKINNSFWNPGNLGNLTAANFIIGFNYYNYGNIPFVDPILYNYGNMEVGGSLYNIGNASILGNSTGLITVADSSINTGIITGYNGTYFTFCDLTPPATAPFVDVNTGTIDPNINWCTAVGLNNYTSNNEVSIFPNPNSGSFVIVANSLESFNLIDELGRIVSTITLNENNNFKKEIKFLQNGVYYLKSLTKNSFEKIVVTQ